MTSSVGSFWNSFAFRILNIKDLDLPFWSPPLPTEEIISD